MKLMISLLVSNAVWGNLMAGTVYVSSPKAKTYHTNITCTGLKRASDPRQGPEEAAKLRGMKECARCNKPAAQDWTQPLSQEVKVKREAFIKALVEGK